jgi:hypothetical protein
MNIDKLVALYKTNLENLIAEVDSELPSSAVQLMQVSTVAAFYASIEHSMEELGPMNNQDFDDATMCSVFQILNGWVMNVARKSGKSVALTKLYLEMPFLLERIAETKNDDVVVVGRIHNSVSN